VCDSCKGPLARYLLNPWGMPCLTSLLCCAPWWPSCACSCSGEWSRYAASLASYESSAVLPGSSW